MSRGNYIRTPNGKKQWTEAEERYLEESWGRTSLKTIAKKLGRSESAVVVRIQRLGLGPGLQNGERISWNQFVIALLGGANYGGGYLKKRLIAAGFPVHTQIVRGHNGARFTTVDIDEFWKFAEENKDLFDFSRMEAHAFGPEPEWATLKRQLDAERLRNGHAHNDPWTEGDDHLLKQLLKQYKYTYTDLAERLHRSEGAVKRRITDLGLLERPIRRKPKPWTKDEENRLIEMRKQGYGWDNIAAELNRTALCVRGKYERMLNPEYTKREYRNAREKRDKHERQQTCRHYVKALGCEIDREACRYCRHYEAIGEGEKQKTGYVGIREIKPEEIREHQAVCSLKDGAEWSNTPPPDREGGNLTDAETILNTKGLRLPIRDGMRENFNGHSGRRGSLRAGSHKAGAYRCADFGLQRMAEGI